MADFLAAFLAVVLPPLFFVFLADVLLDLLGADFFARRLADFLPGFAVDFFAAAFLGAVDVLPERDLGRRLRGFGAGGAANSGAGIAAASLAAGT